MTLTNEPIRIENYIPSLIKTCADARYYKYLKDA